MLYLCIWYSWMHELWRNSGVLSFGSFGAFWSQSGQPNTVFYSCSYTGIFNYSSYGAWGVQMQAWPCLPELTQGHNQYWSELAELCWTFDLIHLLAYPQGKHLPRNVSLTRVLETDKAPVFTATILRGQSCFESVSHNHWTSFPGDKRLYLTGYWGINLLLQRVVRQDLQTVLKVGKTQ